MKLKEQILNRLHSRFEDNRNQQKDLCAIFNCTIGGFWSVWIHLYAYPFDYAGNTNCSG